MRKPHMISALSLRFTGRKSWSERPSRWPSALHRVRRFPSKRQRKWLAALSIWRRRRPRGSRANWCRHSARAKITRTHSPRSARNASRAFRGAKTDKGGPPFERPASQSIGSEWSPQSSGLSTLRTISLSRGLKNGCTRGFPHPALYRSLASDGPVARRPCVFWYWVPYFLFRREYKTLKYRFQGLYIDISSPTAPIGRKRGSGFLRCPWAGHLG